MKNYKELEERVIKWAGEKGILEKATPLAQAEKTIEEADELIQATTAQSIGKEYFINSKGKDLNVDEEIKDALGDILVTIIIQAKMQGLDLLDCLESALNIIEKRTGKMENGVFVKDK